MRSSFNFYRSSLLPSENIREWGEGPYGDRVVLWKSQPDGNSDGDGGFDHNAVSINHTSMYRLSIWLKKTNSKDGTSYFGTQWGTLRLDGTLDTNPYFWYGDLPELDKWYLLVGYIHGSGNNLTINYGGIYDGITGVKVNEIADFKFPTSATITMLRSYLYCDPNTSDKQYFYAPRIELVNGNEPPIATLLGLKTASQSQGYFTGNVGIKTATPRDYELAVNGKIRTKEVKVETANWPDYVFEDGYKLKTLEELAAFIKINKHLPEIPSAKLMMQNGFELGEMNKSLLKKIEELTLHLIEKYKELQLQQSRLDELNIKLQELYKIVNKK
eukprot:Opistho-1_new@81134